MLKVTGNHGSFYDADYVCKQLIPKDSFYRKFSELDRIFCGDNGRPPISLSFLATSYNYDAVGNALAVTDLSGPTTYGYDNLYQLTVATRLNAQGGVLSTQSFGYSDKVGNRTSLNKTGGNQTYGYASGNELTSVSGASCHYDNAGNMTSCGVTAYGWDALNRLVRISNSSVGPVTYVYDGDNHRVQKLSASVTINYFYDGNSEVAETDGNGNILRSFNPGISMKDKQGNKLYYLLNGHGDVAGLMDANQNLVQSYYYDPFGAALGQQKDPNNLRYVGTGGVYSDDDVNLQYMMNRWYNPAIGRFISRDPIGLKGGMNLYCYMSNGPLRGVDPLGLCGQTSVSNFFSQAGVVLGNVSEGVGNITNTVSAGLNANLSNIKSGVQEFVENAGLVSSVTGVVGNITEDLANQNIKQVLPDIIQGVVDFFMVNVATEGTLARIGDPGQAALNGAITHEMINGIFDKYFPRSP